MLANIAFAVFAGVMIVSAFFAVWLKNVFYNAMCLILSLFCVAAMFIFLGSEFLAVLQVIIYIGAISIAIIFAIMLSRPMFQKNEKRNAAKVARSLVIAGLLFVGVSKILKSTTWPVASVEGDYSVAALGKNLLTANALPFEAVSLVLLVAIIGALVISGDRAK